MQDLRVVEQNYPDMRKWITHMETYLRNDLMPRDTYGDWCVPPESAELIHSRDPSRKTDATLIGTAYFYRLAPIDGTLTRRFSASRTMRRSTRSLPKSSGSRSTILISTPRPASTAMVRTLPACFLWRFEWFPRKTGRALWML
jgi:hypothetical protein